MLKPTRVNITRVLNTKSAKKMKRNGRDIIVVPSATLPDDVVMNRIKYPKEEIAKSFKGLEGTPAPLGHPTVNKKFVSAKSPEGINVGWVGAWNENVRQENGRVFLDKVIDVEVANRSEDGKRVLDAIEKGKPIHTSTGLVGFIEKVNHADYDATIHDMEFDHDAILLDFAGAATPEQGVGIFVNSSGEAEDVEVVNSMWDDANQELDWAVDSIVRALEKKARFPIVERIKAAITEAFRGIGAEETTTNEEAIMSNEDIAKLSAKVDALPDSLGKTLTDAIVKGVGDAFTNALKPLVDAQTAVLANEKAKEEEEKAGLIDKIVKANVLDEAAAKTTPITTLKALVANIKVDDAAPVRTGGFQGNSNVSAFKPPVAQKGA